MERSALAEVLQHARCGSGGAESDGERIFEVRPGNPIMAVPYKQGLKIEARKADAGNMEMVEAAAERIVWETSESRQ